MKQTFKRVKAGALAACMLFVLLAFTGCSEVTVNVENLLVLNKSFAGERIVTCSFGKTYEQDEEKKEIITKMVKEACPGELVYEEVINESGYNYIFKLSFASKQEYRTKIKSIIGRDIMPVLETPNSEIAKGWSYSEDFDGMELIGWLEEEILAKGYKDIKLIFESVSNVVNFEGDIVSSQSSELDIFEVEGYPVNGVSIETTNNKNGSYDRRITLSVPQTTYDQMGGKLNTILQARTDPEFVSSGGWLQRGKYQEYEVIYKGINLKALKRLTAMFLDCESEDIYYGDENQSSTPLAEQLVFEENINTRMFIAQEDKAVSFSYKYSLPLKTTYGQGTVFEKGVWERKGEWIDGVYTLECDGGVFDIRIPDGMQYTITGIDVALVSKGENSFVRTFDFLYDRKKGEEGRDYAYTFLKNQGVNVSKEKDDRGLFCRITQAGTANEISNELGDIFGGGNFLTYEKQTSAMAVVTDITVKDSVNIGYLLVGQNAEVPFSYTVTSTGGENLNGISAENRAVRESAKVNKVQDGKYEAAMVGGENEITYVATVPYIEGVVTYCLISSAMLVLAAVLILFFYRKTKKINEKERKQMLLEQKIEEKNKQKKADENEEINMDEDFFNHF